MEYDDYSFCNSLLKPGEMIRWRGKPGKRHLLRKGDWRILLISVVALAYLLLEYYRLLNLPIFDDFYFFIMFGGRTCCLLTVAYVGYRFLVRPFLRKHTLYVITNRQVIAKGWRKTKTMDLKDPLPIYTDLFKDGNGIIAFGQHGLIPIYYGNGRINPMPVFGHFELENIPDAKYVYDLIYDINYALNFGEEE